MKSSARINHLKVIAALFIGTWSSHSMAQSILPWTEQNSTLGLGYPVPIPVDTTEPFDGFRSYNGLFAKHQSMALNNDYITGQVVGQSIYNRDIWAYVLSDEDDLTPYGVKEGAMMANGGIHAREWQTPETVTGIMEAFDANSQDQSFYQYLLENATIITIPVNNVDGFLQTQRYPAESWFANNTGPRDGRMRRKNMRDVDEVMTTENDHLLGVDLNRNNAPFWATTNESSFDVTSQIYHGSSVDSEPETLARLNAASLVEFDQLRVYTDIHSFSQVHFSKLTFNQNRNTLQTRLLNDFTNFHRAFPAGKNYVDLPDPPGTGIGTTADYFASIYEIPSWTLEIEPSNRFNLDAHPDLPGFGADYGGFGNTGADGFILPESEIRRVREQLAETFMVIWYGQAGPPSIIQYRIIDIENNAIIYDAEWDVTSAEERVLYQHQFSQILSDKNYALMLKFDKPMRDRGDQGQLQVLQGQSNPLNPIIRVKTGDQSINVNFSNGRWLDEKTDSWESYSKYKDDTYVVEFELPAELVAADDATVDWEIITTDMIGQNIDANPATIVTWRNGQWQNYEDSNGNASIIGGFDRTLKLTVSGQSGLNQRLQKPQTALLYDPSRDGEGFNFESLGDDNVLVQWYTFDADGNDKWLLGTSPLMAQNAVNIPQLLSTSGGVFGPEFDIDEVFFNTEGSLEMIFEAATLVAGPNNQTFWVQNGKMKYTTANGQKLRTDLVPITLPAGLISPSEQSDVTPTEVLNAASVAGSWFNPERDGEGFHIQETITGKAVILWYSYDFNGNQKWFIGSDGVISQTTTGINFTFDQVFEVGQGTPFGADFNTNDIQLAEWGRIEVTLECTTGTFKYTAIDSAYGSDEYGIEPITRPVVNEFVCPL
ncbi:M14 family zinc carboxypeptidase [Marinicella sp. S1101]|uniref:M14 family zinc carboxypeptidase n=1 Tax=Marinicella marina TaxID=2996016 RepID=UPI002260E92F|nr:M14 family zinc carboxypeptidase [Marinicella marina]MCX7554044.1 M14 family zinc carboxypeptidase [Marinicella marina]MDJ1140536.1 M14 family zinc carboxypeptidase [Marinicella marina]